MMYESFADLLAGYLDTLTGRASHSRMCMVAREWISRCTTTPTRAQILERHTAKGHGHFQRGASQANTELALMRAAFRWGLYQERWMGGDPTAGIKKWKTPKRKRVSKFEEIKMLLQYFERATTETEIRDRAVYGLMLFTGCRPSEARCAPLAAITSYGNMGCWIKGKTKTGENQELPLPRQLMPWIAAWKAIRPVSSNPYLFPGQAYEQALGRAMVRVRWQELRVMLGITGLWTYDLRRTLACHTSNELHFDDGTIRAILNHFDGSALGHYRFKSFDSLTGPIQQYADWLCALKGSTSISASEPTPPTVTLIAPIQATPVSLQPFIPPLVSEPARQSGMRPLTGRERQVLALIAEGRSYKDIANTLTLSIPTVASYRGRLLDRLQLTSTGDLIAYAREHALTTMPMVVIKRGRIGSDRPHVTRS